MIRALMLAGVCVGCGVLMLQPSLQAQASLNSIEAKALALLCAVLGGLHLGIKVSR